MGVVILFSQTQCPTLSHYKRRYHLSQCITCHSFEISTLCSSSLEVDAVCEHAAITCGCLPPSFFPHFTFTSLNSSSPSLSTSQNCSGVSSWSAKCKNMPLHDMNVAPTMAEKARLSTGSTHLQLHCS